MEQKMRWEPEWLVGPPDEQEQAGQAEATFSSRLNLLTAALVPR